MIFSLQIKNFFHQIKGGRKLYLVKNRGANTFFLQKCNFCLFLYVFSVDGESF